MQPLDHILGPPILALVFLSLGWPYVRLVSGGRPLNRTQRQMLFYGFLFVLGMGYSMALVAYLHRPGQWSLILTAGWGLLLGIIAWWRRRCAASCPEDESTG